SGRTRRRQTRCRCACRRARPVPATRSTAPARSASRRRAGAGTLADSGLGARRSGSISRWADSAPARSVAGIIPPVPELAIEVRGLRKCYGDFEAVRGIEFEVHRGEVFGLLGPNGAGKTTTVEILEGYRDRTEGAVAVLGFDPGERSRALR